MLEVMDLKKKFKQTLAVDGVNLYLEQGEIVGLLGPNGAGKSTTISMISSLIAPTSGDVRYFNESIVKKPQKLREHLGVVPQEIALYENLTGRENLQFFGKIYKIDKNQLAQKIEEVLDIIGLKEKQNALVKTFSGGMKRRLNIGVALLHEPTLIFMDEPTVGIDPQSRNYILETVKRLNKEKNITILYTSHYMEEVEYLCDRIYIMDQGHIIAAGSKDEIKHILSAEQTILIEAEDIKRDWIKLLENHPSVNKLTAQDKRLTLLVPKEMDFFQTVIETANETNTVLKSVQIQTPTLEDVFLHLTGRALRD
ncbi:ABC transporter ATP-binding protein [Salinibacillus xinjiangensis]|uniref:ATP-binding cassette domain-containing protein n=1 Tax=Salinibacillus xinjiangensis TaxID=1229268 RepID=A0A6G1X922_9BACI|nr:ABC transporter ATP-binding protein [Salinibacillus xinjiangensis]MRG87503.1 ATP-binding cassette domain-containing protein [Salinibacillus xinjiangensis]